MDGASSTEAEWQYVWPDGLSYLQINDQSGSGLIKRGVAIWGSFRCHVYQNLDRIPSRHLEECGCGLVERGRK